MLLTRGILLCETNPTLRRGQMHLSIRCAANGLPILVWPSLVRRLIWVQEIAGSNPATKTIYGGLAESGLMHLI